MSAAFTTVTRPLSGVVARNVALLGAGELISRVIGFAATIYIARRLGAEAYGMIGIGLAMLLYATAVVDAGLEHTGPREVADAGDRLPELVSSLLIARIAWGLVVTALIVLVTPLLLSGEERLVVTLYALALLPVSAYTRWVHIGLQNASIVSLARVASDLARVIAIFTLVHGREDLIIVPLAQIGGDLIVAAVLFFGIRRAAVPLRLRVNPELTRAVLRRAAPMAVSGILAVMIYNADLVFLRVFRDRTEVGLYLAGYTLLNLLGILGHVTALALVPAFTRLRDRTGELVALFEESMARAFAAALPMAVGGFLIAPLLIQLVFGEEYASSAPILAILVWSMPFVMLRSVLQAALIAHGRQDRVLRTTIAAASTNVSLNFIAVPLLGMYGAALTTLAAEAVRMATAHAYARGVGLPAAPALRLARSVAAALLMGAVLLLVKPESVWLALSIGVATYVIGLWITGGIRLRRGRIEVAV